MPPTIAIAVPSPIPAKCRGFSPLSPVSAAAGRRGRRNQWPGYEYAEPKFGSTYANAYDADPRDRC